MSKQLMNMEYKLSQKIVSAKKVFYIILIKKLQDIKNVVQIKKPGSSLVGKHRNIAS